MKVETSERIALHEGAAYLMRDTFIAGKWIALHYGVQASDGLIEWCETHQGVEFAEIEPVFGVERISFIEVAKRIDEAFAWPTSFCRKLR